jgi:hypothetical protein
MILRGFPSVKITCLSQYLVVFVVDIDFAVCGLNNALLVRSDEQKLDQTFYILIIQLSLTLHS